MEYLEPTSVVHNILCCSCGTAIPPNPANMCVNCIRNEVDITEGIPKQAILYFCRTCERYSQPPAAWVKCELESRELLTLCLKKLKGLNKVRLVDASFVWTEPHSRRIKMKVTIQKEVFTNTILQQVFVVEFTINNQQCDTCTRRWANDHWNGTVQVRQKTSHKKTFFYLEQLILKHRAHAHTVNIKESPDGLDFYFATKSDACKMVDFLNAVVPVRSKSSQRLIAHDTHSNTFNFKYTYLVEIAPICKDDLVCLPPKLARSMGNINQLVLCSRVGTTIHFVDPQTLQHGDVPSTVYWRWEFSSVASYKQLTEFMVLQVIPLGQVRGKYALAEVEVARLRDFGVNDITFFVKTHMGNLLKCGDTAYGYDLTRLNSNDENANLLDFDDLPQVVLVKKLYPASVKSGKRRQWQLRQLEKETAELTKREEEKKEEEYEHFMSDIAGDKELRAHINLYKKVVDPVAAADAAQDQEDNNGEEDDEEDPEAVGLEELLDDMTMDDPDAAPDADAEDQSNMEE